MTLTDFTSYADIRAVLGVAPEEIEDTTLALPLYYKELQFLLGDIEPTLEATYGTLLSQPSCTPQEQKVVDVLQVFSAYAVAKSLLTSLPLFSPQRVQDGRAEQQRFNDPFQDLRDGVDSSYLSLLARLKSALEGIGLSPTAAVTRSYFTTSTLATDPVTA